MLQRGRLGLAGLLGLVGLCQQQVRVPLPRRKSCVYVHLLKIQMLVRRGARCSGATGGWWGWWGCTGSRYASLGCMLLAAVLHTLYPATASLLLPTNCWVACFVAGWLNVLGAVLELVIPKP